MTQASRETGALPLFNHTTRKDWGVAVLVREDGGKRAYLFEDGGERIMANGYHQLMRRVEQPNAAQRAFYERQQAVLARRAQTASSTGGALGFLEQLEKLHEQFPAGIVDPKWVQDVRGEDAEGRAPRHRLALIREAQEQLAPAALDSLIKSQQFAQLWGLVTTILSRTDLVPAAQLKTPKSVNADALRTMALAVRELLHGKGPFEQRFDAYLAALTLVFNEPPHWEIATALSAAFHPDEHVCIAPTAFRSQLKAMGSRGSALAKPTSAGYTRLLNMARLISNKLRDQGQTPRDLFDVYDFIRTTLGPAPKVRAPKAKARAKEVALAAPESDAESDTDSDGDSDSDSDSDSDE